MPTIQINRAPVLTLWAAVVAERLGYDHDAALTFGKAVAGPNAQAKARRLGIVKPATEGAKKRGFRQRGAAGGGERMRLAGLGGDQGGVQASAQALHLRGGPAPQVQVGTSIASPPRMADSWAQIPAAVQFAAVAASIRGFRPSTILRTNSCTRWGCEP
jgi:hypothetical protein